MNLSTSLTHEPIHWPWVLLKLVVECVGSVRRKRWPLESRSVVLYSVVPTRRFFVNIACSISAGQVQFRSHVTACHTSKLPWLLKVSKCITVVRRLINTSNIPFPITFRVRISVPELWYCIVLPPCQLHQRRVRSPKRNVPHRSEHLTEKFSLRSSRTRAELVSKQKSK